MNDEQAYWQIRKQRPYRSNGRWTLELTGPTANGGRWIERYRGDCSEMTEGGPARTSWAWSLRDEHGYYLPTGWEFSGLQPQFTEETSRWTFSGAAPELLFYEKGKPRALKFRVSKQGVMHSTADLNVCMPSCSLRVTLNDDVIGGNSVEEIIQAAKEQLCATEVEIYEWTPGQTHLAELIASTHPGMTKGNGLVILDDEEFYKCAQLGKKSCSVSKDCSRLLVPAYHSIDERSGERKLVIFDITLPFMLDEVNARPEYSCEQERFLIEVAEKISSLTILSDYLADRIEPSVPCSRSEADSQLGLSER